MYVQNMVVKVKIKHFKLFTVAKKFKIQGIFKQFDELAFMINKAFQGNRFNLRRCTHDGNFQYFRSVLRRLSWTEYEYQKPELVTVW